MDSGRGSVPRQGGVGRKMTGGVKIKTWTRQAQVGCWGGQKKDRGGEKSPGGSEKRRARSKLALGTLRGSVGTLGKDVW